MRAAAATESCNYLSRPLHTLSVLADAALRQVHKTKIELIRNRIMQNQMEIYDKKYEKPKHEVGFIEKIPFAFSHFLCILIR